MRAVVFILLVAKAAGRALAGRPRWTDEERLREAWRLAEKFGIEDPAKRPRDPW